MKKVILFIFCILLLISLANAQDVHVWQGQYYSNTTFNEGTYEFNFTIFDASTNGNKIYTNSTNITTGTFGEWKTEQWDVTAACNDSDTDYFLEITIDSEKQADRRRLTMVNYIKRDTDNTINYNFETTKTGFFGYLGSLSKRITTLFVNDLDINGTLTLTGDLNISSNFNSTANISANNYFTANGNIGISNTTGLKVCTKLHTDEKKCNDEGDWCTLQVENGLIVGCN